MNFFAATGIVLGMLSFSLTANSQPVNWQNKDPQKDSVFGASVDKAYNLLLKNKKSVTVIIAVIDTGIDTCHET